MRKKSKLPAVWVIIAGFALSLAIFDSILGLANNRDYQSVGQNASIKYGKSVHNIDKDTYYDTIQAAINDANVGDEIFVSARIYYENVKINKTLTLMGADRNTTIIDGNGTGDVVKITADWVNVSGFGVRNGYYSGVYLSSLSNNNMVTNCGVYNNYYHGIKLYYSSNNAITNCTIYNNSLGVMLYNSHNTVIMNCTVYNITWDPGIYLDDSSNNNITNCIVYDNPYGIYLDYASRNNLIANCTAYNNSEAGVYFYYLYSSLNNNRLTSCVIYNNGWGVVLWSTNCNIITDCAIYNNSREGFVFDDSSNNTVANCAIYSNKRSGVWLAYSSNNTITNCSVHNNSKNGTYITSSSNNNQITYCHISENDCYGVYIYYSSSKPSNYNVIHHNNFVENGVNAYDPHTNFWDNGYPSGGNYWSDYTGVDEDGDGIGDTPYNISGGSNKDRYPLMRLWGEEKEIDWWPMFRHDPQHTGYSASKLPEKPALLWSYNTESLLRTSPAIGDGIVFISSLDGTIYAISEYTGTLIWNYATGMTIDYGGHFRSSPAVSDDKVVVGLDNSIYCLNKTTGALIWNHTTGGKVWSSPTIANNKVFVGSSDRKIYALEIDTGVPAWNYTAMDGIVCSPAVASNKVFFRSWDGNTYALNETTGALVWNRTTEYGGWASPAVADSKVFFGTYCQYVPGGISKAYVYALDQSNGSVNWKICLDHPEVGIVSSPAVAYGKVFIGGSDGLYALNKDNGSVIWKYNTTGFVISSPAVANGKVVIASEDYSLDSYLFNLYCLNEQNGSPTWSYLAHSPFSSSALANGKIFVSSYDGKVYCFGYLPDEPPTINITYPKDNQTASGIITITGSAYPDSDSRCRVYNVDKHLWYLTIQYAVNDADDGNKLLVRAGKYYENVVITKKINLAGESRDKTIIRGGVESTICVYNTSGVIISNLSITGEVGILVVASNNTQIINCTIYNTSYNGVYLGDSSNTILRGNTLKNNRYNFGIWGENISYYHHDIDTSNMINGKPIYYIIWQNDLIFDESMSIGYLGFISCSNITVRNLVLSDNDEGLLFVNVSRSTITNCHVNSNFRGIFLYLSSNNTVTNCLAYNNSFSIDVYHSLNNYLNNCSAYHSYLGIDLSFSPNTTLTNCIAYGNQVFGIRVEASSDCNLTNCTVYNNSHYGFELVSSSNNYVTNCTAHSNFHGIYFSNSTGNAITNCAVYNNSEGIELWYFSSDNIITNCAVYNNSYGIYLSGSSNNNRITYCNITENSNYGIYIYYFSYPPTNYNIFHHNNFINNSQNAYDPHTNYWDDKIGIGNYWDDYTGTDANGDGIGDTPYNIPGGNNKDRYPLMNHVNIQIYKHLSSRQRSICDIKVTKNVGATPNLLQKADSNGTYVQKVEVKIDNSSWQLANGTTNWYFVWNTTTVSNGRHTIYVRAYDGIDYSEIKSVDVYVDNIVGLTYHAPIHINGNDDFVLQATNEGWTGDGTENNPYIIQNYDINAGTANYSSYAGIHIENTNAYFIIRNCIIHDGYEEDVRYNYGIYLYNVTNGKIENVTSYNNSFGIYLYDSPRNNIANCAIYNNSWYGTYLGCSPNSTITNCNVYNNSYGISLSHSLNCKVENCTVYNHIWYGILVSSQSSNNRIVNCVVYNSSYCGIQVSSSTYNVVVNCTVYNNSRYGVYLSCSQHNQIANSTLYNNSNYNIYISSSLYDQITNCLLYNSNYGGYFYACLYDQVEECTFYNNRYYGIYFTSSLYNQITNNRVINCSSGIYFYFSFYNQITNCALNNNSNSGGYFQFSSNNTVTRCNISANNWGLYFYSGSNNNCIYYNRFINNTDNAYDECINYWDCNGEGNRWGNYTGPDNNGDCIGDIPYSVSGGSNKDNYPLMHEFTWWDTEMPVISLLSPDNDSVIKPGTVLEFDITDDNLWKASYSLNNGVTQYFSLPYNISTNGWEEGAYNITVYAKDWGMNEISKMFIFTVDGTPPTATITEENQIINITSFTMHWSTNATDIQYYEISIDGSHWVNVGTNTSYTFTNLAEGFNTLYVRGIDLVNNAGTPSSITIVVEIPISEGGAPHKEEINWSLYGTIIIAIFIALMLVGIGITRVRVVKRRVLRLQRVKCVYCQETATITFRDRPLLFQCQKCGGKSVIR